MIRIENATGEYRRVPCKSDSSRWRVSRLFSFPAALYSQNLTYGCPTHCSGFDNSDVYSICLHLDTGQGSRQRAGPFLVSSTSQLRKYRIVDSLSSWNRSLYSENAPGRSMAHNQRNRGRNGANRGCNRVGWLSLCESVQSGVSFPGFPGGSGHS